MLSKTKSGRAAADADLQLRSEPIVVLAALELEIEEMDGWSEPIDGCRRIADLPANARAYVERLGALLELPIDLVSVGRERSQLAR